MSDLWWYLSRSSGIVAMVLMVAALMWGFFFKARATGTRHRPAWWLDLHKYLGGLAAVFTGVHLVAVIQDSMNGIGLLETLVPMTATGWALGITLGVIPIYLLGALVFSSWPKRRFSRKTWLAVHLTSIPAVVMVGFHAWMVGSSAGYWWFQALLAVLAGAVMYPGVLRLAEVFAKRRRQRDRQQQLGRRLPARSLQPAHRAQPVPSTPPVGVPSGADDRDRTPVGVS